MKKPFYTLYDKVKVYSGAPVNKGFYDRNLNRANKLYIKDNWQPPKPKPIKNITKNTFSQKVNNYMNDYKILKQKFNFPEEEKQIKYVDKSYDQIDEEKIFIMSNIIDEGDKLYDQNLFKNTDEIIDSMKDDKNYIFIKDLSLLKTTQNINDYNLRLFQKSNEIEIENENENELISQTDEEKNISINNINNEAKIDENNDEQIEEINVEEIENKENKDMTENKENNNIENDENTIIKNEEKIINDNKNNNVLLKDKIINKDINENENIEYPLFESIIKCDYNKEYNPYDYYNEEFKKKIEEFQEIEENGKKIENNNNIFAAGKEELEYENEFNNEEENSYNVSKVFDEDDINESNNEKIEEVQDFIKESI